MAVGRPVPGPGHPQSIPGPRQPDRDLDGDRAVRRRRAGRHRRTVGGRDGLRPPDTGGRSSTQGAVGGGQRGQVGRRAARCRATTAEPRATQATSRQPRPATSPSARTVPAPSSGPVRCAGDQHRARSVATRGACSRRHGPPTPGPRPAQPVRLPDHGSASAGPPVHRRPSTDAVAAARIVSRAQLGAGAPSGAADLDPDLVAGARDRDLGAWRRQPGRRGDDGTRGLTARRQPGTGSGRVGAADLSEGGLARHEQGHGEEYDAGQRHRQLRGHRASVAP